MQALLYDSDYVAWLCGAGKTWEHWTSSNARVRRLMGACGVADITPGTFCTRLRDAIFTLHREARQNIKQEKDRVRRKRPE